MSDGGKDKAHLPMSRLEDFKTLSAAERKLRDEVATGQDVVISNTRPAPNAPIDVQIRASFIRYLALGGCDACRPGPKGVRVVGALITGDGPKQAETVGLDLEGCTLRGDFVLINCCIPDPILFRRAQIRTLNLHYSILLGGLGTALTADGLEATGGVLLRGVEAIGSVRLLGAKLGASLECDNARFKAVQDKKGNWCPALFADGLETTGGALLREVRALGEVRLVDGKLGGKLECDRAHFNAVQSITGYWSSALAADRLNASGGASLLGAQTIGEVRLLGARLGGDLSCAGAQFDVPEGVDGGRCKVFNLYGAQVTGTFFWRYGNGKPVRTGGVVDLNAAVVGNLNDDEPSWPQPGWLILDRFRYGAITSSIIDVERRLNWLALQRPEDWGAEFWPHPYEHLAKVLRESGHQSDARTVLIKKELLKRQARRGELRKRLKRVRTLAADSAAPGRLLARLWASVWRALHLALRAIWDWLLHWVIGYGHQPEQAALCALVLLLSGVWVFDAAADGGAIKPNNAFVLRSAEWVQCDTGGDRRAGFAHQLTCFQAQPEAQSYPDFNAFIYSLDTLVPVVSMEMQEFWIPDENRPWGGFARVYLWIQIVAGWALSLLAIAGFSGLVKSD